MSKAGINSQKARVSMLISLAYLRIQSQNGALLSSLRLTWITFLGITKRLQGGVKHRLNLIRVTTQLLTMNHKEPVILGALEFGYMKMDHLEHNKTLSTSNSWVSNRTFFRDIGQFLEGVRSF